MPEPAVMRAREVPGEQTTVATAASVGERVQKTARLFNPHGLPSITWEGGEDESALKDIWKQSAAQRGPAQLRSSFQPEPRREATCTEHPKKALCLQPGNLAVTERTRCTAAGEPSHKMRGSCTNCIDTNCIGTICIGTNCIGTNCIGTNCIGNILYREQIVSGTNFIDLI
jgi:hypothetical protein